MTCLLLLLLSSPSGIAVSEWRHGWPVCTAATDSRGSHVLQVYMTSSELVGIAGVGAAAELLQPTLACAVAEFLATLPGAGML